MTQAIEWEDDDDPTSEPIEDDFDDYASKHVPAPTRESEIDQAVTSG
ncbi:hypothetical protein ABZ667_44225 [Streptomyces lavendulae]